MPLHQVRRIEKFRVDTAFELNDLLGMMCEHWDDLLVPEFETLGPALECLVMDQHSRSSFVRPTYLLMHRRAHQLLGILTNLHDAFHPAIEEVEQDHFNGRSVGVRIIGWNARQPVFELIPRI